MHWSWESGGRIPSSSELDRPMPEPTPEMLEAAMAEFFGYTNASPQVAIKAAIAAAMAASRR